MVDYYPYGKVLREHTNCEDARYLTTHHERDKETDLDYRGARFYDSDIGRFLSLDPLAMDFPSWSDYNYVLGNPIRLIDSDGRAPEDIILKGANNSSVTIKTDLIDFTVDASRFIGDLGGNHSLDGTDFLITALDIVGVVDPTPLSDGLSAALSFEQGNYLDAGASILGATIPYVGDGAKIPKIMRGVSRIKSAIKKGNVSLDTNALVAAVQKGQKNLVDKAINGRNPIISRQAAKEFLTKGDKQKLKDYMNEIGATISRNGGGNSQVSGLQNQAKSLGRNLKSPDAKVAADAINNKATLITRDKKLHNFMNAAGYKAIKF